MNKKNRWTYLSLPVLVAAVLTACAGNKSEPSDALVTTISDQTVDLVGQVHFGMQLADSVQLNHYLSTDSPKADVFLTVWEDLLSAMRSIVYYSADLVVLADAAEGAEAIEPLIELVASLDSDFRAIPTAQPFLSGRDVEAVFAAMREQRTIIDALRLAQPVVLDFSEVVIKILAVADVALAEAIVELTEKIESTHSPMLAYRDNLTKRQNGTLKQLAIMDRVWGGDDGAWAELLASDWALSSEIGKSTRQSPATAMQAEQYLIGRLGAVATIRQQLEPAQYDYQNELAELYQIDRESKVTLRVALLIVDNWKNALGQLARGEKSKFSAFTFSLMQIMYRQTIRR